MKKDEKIVSETIKKHLDNLFIELYQKGYRITFRYDYSINNIKDNHK